MWLLHLQNIILSRPGKLNHNSQVQNQYDQGYQI